MIQPINVDVNAWKNGCSKFSTLTFFSRSALINLLSFSQGLLRKFDQRKCLSDQNCYRPRFPLHDFAHNRFDMASRIIYHRTTLIETSMQTDSFFEFVTLTRCLETCKTWILSSLKRADYVWFRGAKRICNFVTISKPNLLISILLMMTDIMA